MELYVSILNLKFEEGRAQIAQNLHSVEARVPKPDNVPVVVCSASSVCKSVSATTPKPVARNRLSSRSLPAADIDASAESNGLNRLHFQNCSMPRPVPSTAEDRHVDSWGKEGQGGRWTRIHRSARRALFTPFKVAGGPSSKTSLKSIRITRGKFFSSGKTFKVIDDWTVRANAHRLLEGPWIGTTDFRESAEFIDDDSDEESQLLGNKDAEKEDPGDEKKEAAEEDTSADKSRPKEEAAGTEYFMLSPVKTDAAQPVEDKEELARKLLSLRRVPLERFSAQGQLGAPSRRYTTTNLPSSSSTECERHTAEGECEHRRTFDYARSTIAPGGPGDDITMCTTSSVVGKASRCSLLRFRVNNCAW